MSHNASSSPRLPGSDARRAWVAVLVVAGLIWAGPSFAGAPLTAAPASAPAEEGRTWVIDAVDDSLGSRWVSEDTGTSEVTIAIGDTVEWQFDIGVAAQEHDLTSQDTGATWEPEMAEYRAPGDPPVRHTFAEPGVYHYLCSIHGTVMRGTVVVEEADGGVAPSVSADAEPTTGPAPLEVDFVGHAEDEESGDYAYSWDFGVEGAGEDTADSAQATYVYPDPGTYTARLTVTDGAGNTGTDTIDIVVTDGEQSLPNVAASATPRSGAAPVDVAFSTEVTTTGEVEPTADGLTSYPDLAGVTELVRRRGETYASLQVSGVKAEAAHMVHVHEQPCSVDNGGAHFRFDETQPFGADNEIWLSFTSDSQGSGLVEVTQPQRAGAKAVSIVVHDPDNSAKRISCADLVPDTAELAYQWHFGDGTTGEGSDPDHTYTQAGTYTATVTVSSGHAGHDTGQPTVTASVEVVVQDARPPQTRITRGPAGTVRKHRAKFRFASTERASSFECRLDGRVWKACASRTTFRHLRDGRHRLRVRATDAAGNTDATPAVRRWTVNPKGRAG